jgi:hypothetical protein
MLREGNFVFVRAFQSEGKGHEHGREVHHPVSDDQWGKPSCTQVDRHVNEDAGKKGEAPVASEPLVGYERNKTMLQSPHDSYQAVGNPAIAGKSNETRSKIALISKLLGDRPDGPPGQKNRERPRGASVDPTLLPEALALARSDRGANWREGRREGRTEKSARSARCPFRHGPARQKPEEIANAKVFAPGQEKEASAAADVNEGAQTVHQGPAAFQGEALPRRQNTAAKLAWLRSMKKMRAGRKRSGAAERSCPREICLAIS